MYPSSVLVQNRLETSRTLNNRKAPRHQRLYIRACQRLVEECVVLYCLSVIKYVDLLLDKHHAFLAVSFSEIFAVELSRVLCRSSQIHSRIHSDTGLCQ